MMNTLVQTKVLGTLACACVYCACKYVYMCMDMQICVHVCDVEARGCQISIACHFVYRDSLLLNPELTELADSVSQLVLGIPISILSCGIMGRLPDAPGIYVVDRELNLNPHTYVAGASPTESPSQFTYSPQWRENWYLLNT